MGRKRSLDDLELIQQRFLSNVSTILVRMLQVHGQERPALWKFAAKWEAEEGHSMENARQFLLRGLRFHPESKLLYAEAFHLELMYAQMLRQKKETTNTATPSTSEGGGERAAAAVAAMNALDNVGQTVPEGALGVMAPLGNIGIDGEAAREEVMEGKLALLMYESSVKKVKEVGFIISMLSLTKKFDFTQHLQEKIIHDLLTFFPNEELTWDTMARRELEGLSYSPITTNAANSTSGSGSTPLSILGATSSEGPSNAISAALPKLPTKTKAQKKPKMSFKQRIRSCCAVYDAAVKQLDTERMWAFYIECLLELLGNGEAGPGRLKDSGGEGSSGRSGSMPVNPLPRFTRKLVLQAFRAAHNARKMTERYYLMWVDMLQGDNQSALPTTPGSAGGKGKKGTKGAKGKGKAGAANAGGPGRAGKKGKKVKGAASQHKKVARILAAATERLPQSVELWMSRLRHHMTHGGSGGEATASKATESKENTAMDVDNPNASQPSSSGPPAKTPMTEVVFTQASSQLGDIPDAVIIWKFMLHYTQARGNTDRVESLFQDALNRGPAIASALKPLYIEWLVLSKGIAAARKVYDQISVQPPLCLEMHTKMAYLEGLQPVVNLKHARKCFELACDQFGKSNTDVWMEYVKFEMHKGSPENITAIYWRAKKTLDSLQGDIFVSEFSLLKTGMSAALVPSSGPVTTMPNSSIAGGSTPMVLG
ncbi:U3 small nucleolar RNA-associated protein 6 homolog isoform X2 [Ischnura elegans]|uniref:U3 small nucleolar RNA-associated protein 6 homolog isoform X2 n=1 Tax=Ischnura elegans TaxID=197161 RepID=UPI001ED8A95F|nr:U3 small nucleolar RNA-associated protein 6 homolog isoform X2 [Ischnura elegans]